jgi:D-glycero-D-manno-heptose 1,7-bisphosphate phosphatase
MTLLVLDRDGVINEDSDDYIRGLQDWRPIPGSVEAIAALSKAGYRIAIATNQSGLGRGLFTRHELEEIHHHLRQAVERLGGEIAGIYYCPHLPGAGCHCRKPDTGLLTAIELGLGEPVAGAYFIGDSLKDLQCAQAAGCQPVLVKTGKGSNTLAELQGSTSPLANAADVPVFDDLAAAAKAILATDPLCSKKRQAP